MRTDGVCGLERGQERALLAGLIFPGEPEIAEEPLTELGRLAETAGAVVVDRVVQKRSAPHPGSYMGKGKLAEIRETCEALDVNLVIFDGDLSPAQGRNVEKVLDRRVIDRSEVILSIFASHARTRQAKVQVELAQLQYLRPRLKRMWTHLSRIEGGIGMRGPGEKQIEVDRRALNRRIHALRRDLVEFERQHDVRASSRREYFSISLVGYTNAGKSTLLKKLTGADTVIQDRLFATLDTKTRTWNLPGGRKVFLSDTVGFIRGLPHHLVASFHATLKAAAEADLLLHVVDAAHPDAERQIVTVNEVLEEVGAEGVPAIVVLNKLDRVKEPIALELLRPKSGRSVRISAASGDGIESLEEAVFGVIALEHEVVEITLHAGDGKLLSFLAEKGEVLSREYLDDGSRVRIRARLPKRYAKRFQGASANE